MEIILKELKELLRFFEISEENIYTVESWFITQIEERKDEIQDYLDAL